MGSERLRIQTHPTAECRETRTCRRGVLVATPSSIDTSAATLPARRDRRTCGSFFDRECRAESLYPAKYAPRMAGAQDRPHRGARPLGCCGESRGPSCASSHRARCDRGLRHPARRGRGNPATLSRHGGRGRLDGLLGGDLATSANTRRGRDRFLGRRHAATHGRPHAASRDDLAARRDPETSHDPRGHGCILGIHPDRTTRHLAQRCGLERGHDDEPQAPQGSRPSSPNRFSWS
jgi:hypothetical protein